MTPQESCDQEQDRQTRDVERELGLPEGWIPREVPLDNDPYVEGVVQLLKGLTSPDPSPAPSLELRVATLLSTVVPSATHYGIPELHHRPLLAATEGRYLRNLTEQEGIRCRGHNAYLNGCRLGPYYDFARIPHSSAWGAIRSAAVSAFSAALGPLNVHRIVGYSPLLYHLAQEISLTLGLPNSHAILALGDERPAPVVPLQEFSGLRVAVLVDGVMSGTLLERLTSLLTSAGAQVVFQGTLVVYPGAKARAVHYLWEDDPDHYVYPCPECATGAKPRGFRASLGTTADLAISSEALDRWRQEVDSQPHLWLSFSRTEAFRTDVTLAGYSYDIFIDTARLLTRDPLITASLLSECTAKLSDLCSLAPVVIYAGNRSKYPRVAAEFIARAMRWPLIRVPFAGASWAPAARRISLRGRHVLIVDSAVSTGRTIEVLKTFSSLRDAASIRAFVLLSRLTSSEKSAALSCGLAEPLRYLFSFPLPPIRISRYASGHLEDLLSEFESENGTAQFVHNERHPRRSSKQATGQVANESLAIRRAMYAAVYGRHEDVFTGLPTHGDVRLALRTLPRRWLDTPLVREELCALMQNGIPLAIKASIARHLLRHRCHAWVRPGWLTENADVLAAERGASVVLALTDCARQKPALRVALRQEAQILRQAYRSSQGLLPGMSSDRKSRRFDALAKKLD